MILREVQIQDSKIARIVDYHGQHELFAEVGYFIMNLLKEKGYEYIDFFEYGIEDAIIRKAGFHNREDEDNIIPNYFEPFYKGNVDIWTHYKIDGTTFFKADGDQDRPNLV